MIKRIKFEKIPTIAFVILLSLLIVLGFWQMHRAEEKRSILGMQKHNRAASLILTGTTDIDADKVLFNKVKAEGRYDVEHQYLLDNRIKDGKAGYFVLTPFLIEGGKKAVLVNRGWIPLGQSRSQLPDIRINNDQLSVDGRINAFPSVGIQLAGAEIPTAGWPSVVQVVDIRVLGNKLGYPLLPFMIELDEKSPEGYRRDWQVSVVMPPEQHMAYAIQWFGLAFALSMLFIWYSRLR